MDNPCAVTKHTVADDATVLNVDRQDGMVPVAIYALAWVSANFTLGLKLLDPVSASDATAVYAATDDSAVTLTDAKWTTIPEAMGRKMAARDWQMIFASTENAGPFVAQIAWKPMESA